MFVGFIAAHDQYHSLFVEISGYRCSDNTAGMSSGSEHEEMLDNVAPALKQTSSARHL